MRKLVIIGWLWFGAKLRQQAAFSLTSFLLGGLRLNPSDLKRWMPVGLKYGPISLHVVSLLSLINPMATLVFVLNLCGLTRRALAAPTLAPTQNFTALRTDIAPPWVPDPDNRGTWSLLYSCVFTLVLCVWTAIHLNIPSYQESLMSQWLRKLKWVLLAIIAPELGVYTACEQYSQAKRLTDQLARISVRNEMRSPRTIDQSETQLPQDLQGVRRSAKSDSAYLQRA